MNRPDICPDGSDRSFSRIRWNDLSVVEILPGLGENGLREAESLFLIGGHLFSRHVPVPEIYLYEKHTGRIVVEDLGDTLLQHVAGSLLHRGDFQGLFEEYGKVLDVLIHMQFAGAAGFDVNWCWQGPLYNSALAMEKEALYFLNAFVGDYMHLSCPEDALIKEFEDLTERVDSAGCRQVFLHRDFQSRNMMIMDEKIRIIDFQAGRLGPPCYDVASLLHDPYVDIPWTMRYELYEYYLERLKDFDICGEKAALFREFSLFSILRLLQVLGAYGFLSGRKKRPFFKPFILPALKSLKRLLSNWQETDCRHLRSCVRSAWAELF